MGKIVLDSKSFMNKKDINIKTINSAHHNKLLKRR